jgi:hypothetical protein
MQHPSEANYFLVDHAECIRHSYRQLLGKDLLPDITNADFARLLFHAPFALVSHDAGTDPVFNYANLQALQLFEFAWDEFIRLPSRLSAEPVNQAERERLLAAVTEYGYIKDYEGVRLSKTGQRFMIKHAEVWNLLDRDGRYQGQAACFEQWMFLT